MLGWLPIVGPIIDGIVSIFSKAMDTKAILYRVDGSVDIEGMKATAALAAATKDDIGVRLCRDMIMFPIAVWMGFVTWDNIVLHKYPDLVWTVERYPPGLEYLPYAVIAFLFGSAGLIAWKRK